MHVENGMITNQPRGQHVRPVVYYLFCHKVLRGVVQNRIGLHIISGRTVNEADSRLARFIRRKDVTLVAKNGRRLRKP